MKLKDLKKLPDNLDLFLLNTGDIKGKFTCISLDNAMLVESNGEKFIVFESNYKKQEINNN